MNLYSQLQKQFVEQVDEYEKQRTKASEIFFSIADRCTSELGIPGDKLNCHSPSDALQTGKGVAFKEAISLQEDGRFGVDYTIDFHDPSTRATARIKVPVTVAFVEKQIVIQIGSEPEVVISGDDMPEKRRKKIDGLATNVIFATQRALGALSSAPETRGSAIGFKPGE